MSKLISEVSPHFFTKRTTRRIMLDVIIAFKINERVVAVAPVEVYEIEYPYVITLIDQVLTARADRNTFGIQYDHGELGVFVGLKDIRHGIEPGLTGTGATNDKYVEISSVYTAVITDADMLCEDLVRFFRFGLILPVYDVRNTPLGRTVFFTPSVVPFGREIDPDSDSIKETIDKGNPKAALN